MKKLGILVGIIVGSILLAACQPAQNPNSRKFGRLGRGPINWQNGRPAAFQSGTGAQWGQIVNQSGDQVFANALNMLISPTLQGSPADQLLGYVSSQPNQQTGVFFWGVAAMSMQGGGLDSQRSRIHIEIWDEKAGQVGSDGNVIPPVVIHIGSDQQGFVGAQGSIQGGAAQLTFADQYGSILMVGNVMGQYFSGNIQFTNSGSGGPVDLGQFNVPACGFFTCN